MKLNRFIMNSDFDGQKEVADVSTSITTPAMTITYQEGPHTFTKTVEVPSGEYFSNITSTVSILPGKTIPGGSYTITRSDNIGYYYIATIGRQDNTHFIISVRIWRLQNAQGYESSVPSITNNIRIRLYAASPTNL